MKKNLLSLLFASAFLFSANAQWVSGGTQISFSADNHHRPFVSATNNGSYFVVWQATDTTSSTLSKIKIAAYDSAGVLLPGWKVGGDTTTHDNGDYYGGQILTSEDGGVIVAWYGYTAGSNRSHIYTQKYSIAGTALWNSGNPVQVSTGTSFVDEYPIIVSDKHKGFFVTWTRFDSVIDASPTYVYLQHIDSTGHVATGWNANATGVATTNNRQYYPKLAFTPDESSVYVVYAQGLIGATSLILNKYTASTGALASGWTSNGLTLSSGPDVYPDINHDLWLFSDNSNDAVAVWLEAISTANGEAYMQQVSPSGIALFGLSEFLAGAGNGIDYLQVIQEPNMNLLVTYNNLNTFNDLAALNVQPNGVILWNDTLITHGGYSAYPYPAYDGNKGLYAFYVNTNTPTKLYGIGIDSTGKIYKGWSLPGSLFGLTSNYDGFEPNYDVNATYLQNHEAVVAWNRQSTSFYDIYTCNLYNNGVNCYSPDGINEVVEKNDGYTMYPNPSNENITLQGSTQADKLISVYNMVGQQIMTMQTETKQTVLNTSSLATGMYFITVREIETGKVTTLKFIKE